MRSKISLAVVGCCLAFTSVWSSAGVWAEAIFWTPVTYTQPWASSFTGGSPFNTSIVNSGSFRARRICPRYNTGIRAGLSLESCGLLGELSGSYISSHYHSETDGTFFPTLPIQTAPSTPNQEFQALVNINGRARADQSIYHWFAQWANRWHLRQRCNSQLSLSVGVRYVYVQDHLKCRFNGLLRLDSSLATQIRPSALSQSSRLRLSATGPLLGLSFRRSWLSGLGFDLRSQVMALIGSRKRSDRAYLALPTGTITPNFSTTNQGFVGDRGVAIVPAMDLKVAAHFRVKVCKVAAQAEVGYSFLYYWDAFRVVQSGTPIPSLVSQQVSRDLGFAGPTIGVTLSL